MRTTNLIALLLGSLAMVGCSSDPIEPAPVDEMLAPPAEGSGVQLKMVSPIAAGQETERCQFFKAPAEGMYVHREQVRFTAGSHHVLLYTTDYDAIPTKNNAGVEVDTSTVVDCPNGPSADWTLSRVLGGSQSYDGESFLNTLPEGIAVHIKPGTVFLMNVHYVNASAGELMADARINLYSMPKEDVKEEAGLLFFYNPFIHVPAGGKGTARMRCPVTKDISLINVQSHMHRRGVNYVADLTDASGVKLQELYANTEWEAVPVKKFDPLLQIKAGQALDYRCEYQNSETHDVNQGPTSKDEMCMLLGAYYPHDDNLETCLDEQGVPNMTWIGNGTTNGAETLSCFGSAMSAGDAYGCMVNSCAAIGPDVSAFFRCQNKAGASTCGKECSGPDTSMCGPCVEKACEAEQTAVMSAKCE